MNLRRLFIATVVAITVFALGACSDDSNPGNPGGGAKELNSGNIPNGGTFPHRFFTAGTFPYHCSIHGSMTGTVTVADAATDTTATVNIVNTGSSGFQPGAVTIKTGGLVTWNNQSVTHTVTSN